MLSPGKPTINVRECKLFWYSSLWKYSWRMCRTFL